jgi:ElaB/YqjD/DUF883 family membrane-anchored ribosome-binding protein
MSTCTNGSFGKEEKEMREGVVDKVMAAGVSVTEMGHQAARLGASASQAVADAIEDAGVAAKRAMKRGYQRAEDLIDDTSYQIRRSPLRSVATVFCAGLIVGALVVRLLKK